MIKANELASAESCLNKAADDEPIFVLRAKDRIAPKIVRTWALEAHGIHDEEKCRAASELAHDMERWRLDNVTDSEPPYTVEEAKRWAEENGQRLDKERLECEDPSVLKVAEMMPDRSKSLWDSGEWLSERLFDHGATEEQAASICMAQGQRSFMGDPWQAAVDYANEFATTGDTVEKGGIALAFKVHSELLSDE